MDNLNTRLQAAIDKIKDFNDKGFIEYENIIQLVENLFNHEFPFKVNVNKTTQSDIAEIIKGKIISSNDAEILINNLTPETKLNILKQINYKKIKDELKENNVTKTNISKLFEDSSEKVTLEDFNKAEGFLNEKLESSYKFEILEKKCEDFEFKNINPVDINDIAAKDFLDFVSEWNENELTIDNSGSTIEEIIEFNEKENELPIQLKDIKPSLNKLKIKASDIQNVILDKETINYIFENNEMDIKDVVNLNAINKYNIFSKNIDTLSKIQEQDEIMKILEFDKQVSIFNNNESVNIIKGVLENRDEEFFESIISLPTFDFAEEISDFIETKILKFINWSIESKFESKLTPHFISKFTDKLEAYDQYMSINGFSTELAHTSMPYCKGAELADFIDHQIEFNMRDDIKMIIEKGDKSLLIPNELNTEEEKYKNDILTKYFVYTQDYEFFPNATTTHKLNENVRKILNELTIYELSQKNGNIYFNKWLDGIINHPEVIKYKTIFGNLKVKANEVNNQNNNFEEKKKKTEAEYKKWFGRECPEIINAKQEEGFSKELIKSKGENNIDFKYNELMNIINSNKKYYKLEKPKKPETLSKTIEFMSGFNNLKDAIKLEIKKNKPKFVNQFQKKINNTSK